MEEKEGSSHIRGNEEDWGCYEGKRVRNNKSVGILDGGGGMESGNR